MNLPTKDKPRIKFVAKTRKGLPVRLYAITYFTFDERGTPKQVQEWSSEKPQ